MRVELRNGELYTGGDQSAPRAEIYGRSPSPWSTPAEQWLDPEGSERWFTFSVFVPRDFQTATDSRWFTFMQWKGYKGGSPPVALEIKRDRFRLGGANTSGGPLDVGRDLGPIAKGSWTTFTVGLKYSTQREVGWVEVRRDGQVVYPRFPCATMDLVNGSVDPVYIKQGIYRSAVWQTDHTLYFSPTRVSPKAP